MTPSSIIYLYDIRLVKLFYILYATLLVLPGEHQNYSTPPPLKYHCLFVSLGPRYRGHRVRGGHFLDSAYVDRLETVRDTQGGSLYIQPLYIYLSFLPAYR